MRNSLFLTLLICSLTAPAAEPGATNQPTMIEIKSQSARFQFKTNALTFSGGVTVLDPDVLMTCQTLVASFAKRKKQPADTEAPKSKSVQLTSGEEVDQIEAVGDVVIKVLTKEHEGTVGRSERAVYTAADRKITMLGKRPTIKKPNGQRTTADTIIYHIETGVVDVDGNAEVVFERPKSLFNTTSRPPAK